MAVLATVVAVGAAATALFAPDDADASAGQAVLLRNTGATDVFLGGPTVTTGNGYLLASGQSLPQLVLEDNEVVFAVAATTGTVAVLRTRV